MKYVYGATIAFGLLLAASAVLNHVLAGVIPNIVGIMQIIGSVYMLYLAYQIYKMNSGGRTVPQHQFFLRPSDAVCESKGDRI